MKIWNLLTKKEMKDASVDVGANIRKFRDELCYTQEDVANELGIGQSAYQKIEAGTAKITVDRL